VLRFMAMGKTKRIISIKTRIFGFMVAVSVIPTIIITVAASLNTYSVLYSQLISVNTLGMEWASSRLGQFLNELTSTFYGFETDTAFREEVLDWNVSAPVTRGTDPVSKELASLVNRSALVNAAGICVYADGTLIRAESVGVRIRRGIAGVGGEEEEWFSSRRWPLQNNVYLENGADGIYALHGMNRFEDRKPLATVFAKIKTGLLSDIVDSLRLYERGGAFIINDQGTILDIPGNGTGDDSALRAIATDLDVSAIDGSGYRNVGNHVVFFAKAGGGKLSIVTAIPKREIARKVLSTAYVGAFIGLACLIASVFLSAVLSSYLSEPILRLTEKLRNIDMQKLEITGDPYVGDEIATLENRLIRFVDRIKELIIEEYVIKVESKNAQFQALQAQINPHFIHNTLQTIGGMALAREAPEIYEMTSALSDCMRYAMESDQQQTTLSREIQNIENFLAVQRARFAGRFEVAYDIDPAAGKVAVPKLILQPIVENSFRHGFKHATAKWRLSIRTRTGADGETAVTIEDNGVGMPEALAGETNARLGAAGDGGIGSSGHIGLENVAARIRLAYPGSPGVSVRGNAAGGTTVEIRLRPNPENRRGDAPDV